MSESDSVPGGEHLNKKDWGIQQYINDNANNLADPGVRRRTFVLCSWEEQFPKKPPIDKMVDAGFYHSGYDDRVICYSCKADFKQWKDIDKPIFEHKEHANCDFIRGLTGRSEQDNPLHQVTPQGGQTIPVLLVGAAATPKQPAGATASAAPKPKLGFRQ